MALSAGTAYAQNQPAPPVPAPLAPVSPVVVTPPTLAPERRDSGVRVDIPETGALQAPAGAEGVSVTLANVRIEGAFAKVAEEADAVASELRGHPTSLTEIYAVASRIEAIHARAGYVLARVSVPPQELEDGSTLRLMVTDGFIEAVDVSGLPGRVRRALAARTAKLVGRRQVTLQDIEQALVIAGEVPGIALRSTLLRGSQPGGTRIALEGRHQPVSGSLGADNQLDPSLGRWGVNLQVALNSMFGLGEQIYGFVATDYEANRLFDGSGRNRVVGGGAILPLGEGRFSLNPEVTFARTLPTPAFGGPPTRGDLRRLTIRASQSLVRARNRQVGLTLAVEQYDQRNAITFAGFSISHDRYMAARPGLSFSRTGARGGSLVLSAQFSQGLGRLGSISAAQALASGIPFSRQGARTNFSKLTAGASAAWPLGRTFSFSLSARGQTSFGKPIFRAEQFALEGADGLSAYISGRTAVDAGVAVRSELAAQAVKPGKLVSSLRPYAFGAFGTGRVEAPTAVERGSITAFNLGAGARASLGRRVALSAEYARGFSRFGPLDKTNRVSVSARFYI